jgi:hypothetical protein
MTTVSDLEEASTWEGKTLRWPVIRKLMTQAMEA